MMNLQVSKKFKGKLCAYCAVATATTDDHVFAREFFLLEDRHRLPKAPACQKCNSGKSGLEHYLTAVLPFAAKHERAQESLRESLDRRLPRNNKLSNALMDSMKPAWMQEGSGLLLPTASIQFESVKLAELLKLIVRGLTWHHWNAYVGASDYADVMFMPDMGTLDFQDRIRRWGCSQRVVENLGRGTLSYEGVRTADPPELTVWGISMFGGAAIAYDKSRDGGPIEVSSRWWVVTAPPQVGAMLARGNRAKV